MKNLSSEINGILKTYFREEELFEMNKHLLVKNYYKANDFEKLSATDKRQLSATFAPASDRILIDRSITYAKKRMKKEKFIYFLNEISKLCIAHGNLKLAREILSRAKKEIKKDEQKAEIYLTIADMHTRNAKWRKSFAAVNSAKRIYDVNQDVAGKAKCENLIGVIAADRGDINKAVNHFRNGFNYATESNNLEMAGMMETNLGVVNNIIGNYSEARRYFNMAMQKFEKLNDIRRITEIYHNLAMTFRNEMLFDASLQEFDKCIQNAITSKYLSILGIAYMGKADIYISLNKLKDASYFLEKAFDICYQNDDKLSLADIYKMKGIIAREHEDYLEAKGYFVMSIKLNKRLNNQLNLGEAYYELAENYKRIYNFDKERAFLKNSLSIFSKIGDSEMVNKIEAKLKTNENQKSGNE